MELNNFFLTDNKNGSKCRENYLIKNYPDIHKIVINYINDAWYNELPFKEKIWYCINNVNIKKVCKFCSTELKFKNSLSGGYGDYCSISCANKCDEHKDKVKVTNNIKYGSDVPFFDEVIKEKSTKTLMEKYNVDNIFKNKEYIKEKTLLKHGVNHIAKLESTKTKRANTNIDRYGVSTPILKPENRHNVYNKRRKIFLEKYKDLNIINGYGNDIIIHCDKCDSEYVINRALLSHRYLITENPCTNCNPIKQGVSISENMLREFITDLGLSFKPNDRNVINPLELDIYIESKKVSIEYNGLYWHSSKYVNSDYHLKKTELCNDKGIKLIHIFEDEWVYKRDIVKSRIRNILGLIENKIYARKCEIREVKTNEKTLFLNNNHIQGAVGSLVNIGCYYNNELVSLMCFSKKRVILKNKDEDDKYELIRFCNKLDTNVIGGASKLLSYFIKNYKPKEIISYADRRWSTGNLYDKLGFKFDNYSKPNFYYVINDTREHRIKYQKHKLIQKGFDKDKTEDEIMSENGIYRIYDCGTIRYSLKLL